jgi:trans-AT polyketide synthase/acyltransferase/oxidoreductase domain-containing protein
MARIFLFPGQGSQKVGMGAELFKDFPQETAAADAVLGYSLEELCVRDPNQRLNRTEFTQPALYAVNALTFLKQVQATGLRPDFVAGHSLGEYDALFAAGVFDFATGLKLVRKRGQLMSAAGDGGMAAVVGLTLDQIRSILTENHLTAIDIANLNSPTQTVLSGSEKDIRDAQPVFEKAGVRMYIPLKVSGAFHSRYMQPARDEFERFVKNFQFAEPRMPVIANVTARPYQPGETARNLTLQITSPIRWVESMQYLLRQPDPQFEEVGPGKVLTGLLKQIRTP